MAQESSVKSPAVSTVTKHVSRAATVRASAGLCGAPNAVTRTKVRPATPVVPCLIIFLFAVSRASSARAVTPGSAAAGARTAGGAAGMSAVSASSSA
jgi:hypothetical protein